MTADSTETPAGSPGRSGWFAAAEAPDDFVACQRIADALLPPHRVRALLASGSGSPAEALSQFATRRSNAGLELTEKQAQRLAESSQAVLPRDFLSRAQSMGASALVTGAPAYPSSLVPLGDSPAILFVRGTLLPEDTNSLAIVGSRRATLYGRSQAERFARAFVEHGLAVVSGGAAGIDTAAHHAVVEAGGRTIAVLGCGIDISYPSENRVLFDRIVETSGAVISEFALGTKPEPWRFPTRNRIIAGISRATVVIESPEGSGALLTATDAARYGREVWAVPGPVDTGRSRGCHRLIQEGANLADSPEDILTAIGAATFVPQPETVPQRPRVRRAKSADSAFVLPLETSPKPEPKPLPPLTPAESRLLAEFSDTPAHLDVASERAGLSAPEATVAATLLEMKALIRRLPGGLYTRPSETR